MGTARAKQVLHIAELATVASILFLCATCQTETGRDPAMVEDAPEQAVETPEWLFLAPFIPGSGPPVVFHRDVWMHVENWELVHTPGEPFEGLQRYPLTLAMWEDGTVIWAQGTPRQPEYFEGKIDVHAIRQLLDKIDAGPFRRVESMRFTDDALRLPASMIAVLKEPKRFVVCSGLDQMELLEEYCFWKGHEFEEYPFTEFTFEQFCAEVPAPYSRHLQNYARLRAHLHSIVPDQGDRVELEERIRWVVLSAPGMQ